MTDYNYNRIFLGIKDAAIEFTHHPEETTYETIHAFRGNDTKRPPRKGQFVLVLRAKLDRFPSACHHCQHPAESSQDMIRNGGVSSAILLGEFNNKATYLLLRKQRYLCKHCRKTTLAQTSIVDRHCTISKTVKNNIRLSLGDMQSQSLIAKRWKVSNSSVQRVLRDARAIYKVTQSQLPEHLAIDEFKSVKSVKHAMSCILMDNLNHELVEILPGRTQADLAEYLGRFSIEARREVKTITMDMYSPYLDFLPKYFPNAAIVIDRFHIVQLILRALNRKRIKVMNNLRYNQPRDYTKLKRLWKQMLKKREDLDFTEYKSHRLFDGLVTEKMMVEYLLNLDAGLRLAYDYANRLIESLEDNDYAYFEETLIESRKYTFPKDMRTMLNTLTKYLPHIKNSFKYTLSNGVVEGMNNKIKLMKRTGFGYRNFENLRIRIFLSMQYQETKETRPLLFEDEKALRTK